MTVKASWHTATVEVATGDPFADEPEATSVPVDVREVGRPVDLSGRQVDLSRQLVENVNAQQTYLDAGGVDCDLRFMATISCHACPLFDPKNRLCSLSRAQEVIETLMTVRGHGGRRQQGA